MKNLILLLLLAFVSFQSCKKDDDAKPKGRDVSALNGHWKKGSNHYYLSNFDRLDVNDLPATIQYGVEHEFTENSPLGLPDQEWIERGDVVIKTAYVTDNEITLSGDFRYVSKKLKVGGVNTLGNPTTTSFTLKWTLEKPDQCSIRGNEHSRQ